MPDLDAARAAGVSSATPPLAPGILAVRSTLAEWDGLGWQWTGGEGESASAEWFARRMSEAGLDVAVERYPFERTDVTQCTLEVGDHHATGLPLFDGGATDAQGVTGVLTEPGAEANGDVAVIEAVPWDARAQALVDARADRRYRAVIVVTRGPSPGLAPLDCANPLLRKPGGTPVIQVSSEHRGWLFEAASRHAEAKVVARFERATGEGRNVVAVWSGSNRSLAPIVVLAARSGWGPCVGERGGGLVCSLHAARALAQLAATRTVVFAATSGAELGSLGTQAFWTRYPKLAGESLGLLELGANLGARDSALELMGNAGPWLTLLESRLNIEQVQWRTRDVPAPSTEANAPAGQQPTTATPNANSLVLSASPAPAYHLPTDQLPSAVDLTLLLGLSKAVSSSILELAQN